MKFILPVLLVFVFASCAPIPGELFVTESNFDESSTLSMVPAFIDGGAIKLSLFKSSKMDSADIVLRAYVYGITRIDEHQSLAINIDGAIHTFDTIGGATQYESSETTFNSAGYIPGQTWSYQSYKIDRSFLQKMINADKCIIRLSLYDSYVEGDFNKRWKTMAKSGFVKFDNKLNVWPRLY
jgi:hypothetical protein